MIVVNDIVYHKLSKLFFICENKKHERWMNMNEYYVKVDTPTLIDELKKGYFKKLL
jgi:hypothetical protein